MMARKSTKTEETKVEVKAEAAEKAEKKTAAKKPRAAAAAKEPVIKCTIEFGGKNTEIRSIVDSIFEAEGGKDAVQTLAVYIQPENGVAYYVANDKEEGKSVTF